METIDAHQHYWDNRRVFPVNGYPWFLGAVSYGWKQAGLDVLDRSFLPDDLAPQIAAHGVTRTVLINVLHSAAETEWMLSLADAHPSIAGVVGWINLAQPVELVARDLERVRSHPKLVGIRHLAQFEPDEEWLLRSDVLAGFAVLEKAGVPYDLLLKPSQLRCVPVLSEKLPDLYMVIDHLAKPDIKNRVLAPWAQDIHLAAQNPRVFCKLSGMITEADHQRWTPDDLVPYVATVLEAFGTDQVMYGSDWPVCTLAGSYDRAFSACVYTLEKVVGGLSQEVERAIFRENAIRFYKLRSV